MERGFRDDGPGWRIAAVAVLDRSPGVSLR